MQGIFGLILTILHQVKQFCTGKKTTSAENLGEDPQHRYCNAEDSLVPVICKSFATKTVQRTHVCTPAAVTVPVILPRRGITMNESTLGCAVIYNSIQVSSVLHIQLCLCPACPHSVAFP